MARFDRLRKQGITWEQFAFQLVIVLLGVFLALAIGSIASRHEEQGQAEDLLKYVARELRQDAAEIRTVVAIQDSTSEKLKPLIEALRVNGSDSVIQSAMSGLARSGNRTLFARRAAYTMMINRGLLAAVRDQELQIALAELYDHDYRRVETLNEMSDDTWMRYTESLRDYWDPVSRRTTSVPFARQRTLSSANAVTRFSVFYRSYMQEILHEVEMVEKQTEAYVR